jgi:hypothetical protein
LSASLTLSLLTFSSTPPVCARPATPARAPDGTAGRPTGPDAESQRARAKGIFHGGERPLCPSSHADRSVAGQRRTAMSPLRPRAQSPCAETSLPLCRLDRGPIPRGRASASHPPTRIGVLPLFPVRHHKRRRVGGVGRRKEERGREAVSVTPPAHQDRRPHQSPRGRKGRQSALGKKPGQSRDQDAAVNAYAAPPSTPSRPRLHRLPRAGHDYTAAPS